VKIETLDPATIDDAALAAWHDLDVVLSLEDEPDDEPRPAEQLLLEARTPSPELTVTRWLAWDDNRSQVLAYAEAEIRVGEDNQHLAFGWVGIRPELRGRGMGTELFRLVAKVGHAAGRSKLHTWCIAGSPSQRFLDKQGGANVYLARKSRCLVADIDPAQMRTWLDEDRPGYSLVLWEAPTPPEHLQAYADILHVMNTAPMQDMDYEDEVFTPELIQGWESARAAQNGAKWVAAARHDESGAFVGLSELFFDGFRAGEVQQGNTGVDAAHRGHGLGRLLKAANAVRLLEEKPGAVFIDTFNQDENAPMLAINTAMGFRPHRRYTEYQVPIAPVLER
jgi:mycothiol synthase